MSGLKSKLEKGVKKAFDGKLSDAVKPLTYTPPRTGRMNAQTGIRESQSPSASFRGVVDIVSEKDITKGASAGHDIKITDKKITYLISEVVTDSGDVVQIETSGTIECGGSVFSVEVIDQDPTDTVGDLIVRG